MTDIKWVKILVGEFAGQEGIVGSHVTYTPCGGWVTVPVMIDGEYQHITVKLGRGNTLRERLRGKIEEIKPLVNATDQEKIAGSDFFLCLVEEDFFTNEQALAQLKYAISCKKPIHILRLKSVDLQMEHFADADIKSVNDFESTGDLLLAVGRMMGTMKEMER